MSNVIYKYTKGMKVISKESAAGCLKQKKTDCLAATGF
jgi:hypothetical protein